MANYVSVLRKTIDKQSDPSTEVRQRIYEKARLALTRQLEGMDPRPSDAVIARQHGLLEEAVLDLEEEFADIPEADEASGSDAGPENAEVPASFGADDTAQPRETVEVPAEPTVPTPSDLRQEPGFEAQTTPSAPDEEYPPQSLPSSEQDEREDNFGLADRSYDQTGQETDPFASLADDRAQDGSFPSSVSSESDDGYLYDSGLDAASVDGTFSGGEADPGRDGKFFDDEEDADDGGLHDDEYQAEPRKRGGGRRMVAVLAFLLILGGLGYAAYEYGDEIVDMAGLAPGTGGAPVRPADTPNDPALPAAVESNEDNSNQADGQSAVVSPPPSQEPATDPEPAKEPDPADQTADQGTETAPQDPSSIKPFTQRLNADGTEVPGGDAAINGEPRTIVAAREAAPPPQDGPSAPPSDNAASDNAAIASAETVEPAPAGEEATVSPVPPSTPTDADPAPGQTANADPAIPEIPGLEDDAADIRTGLIRDAMGQQPLMASKGQATWTAVEPSGDEPAAGKAIRAQLDIPEDSVKADVTIRRNTDATLPASHLIEVDFDLPEDFESGGVESVQRVLMKDNGQDKGQQLVAVPAKITDTMFIVALNDFESAVATNLDLLENRDMMEMLVIFTSGRRAVLTMEKGEDGSKVFSDVIDSWQTASAGPADSN